MTTVAFGMPGASEWIIIFLVVLLLFGAKRLPELARSLGQAKKEFQKGAREVEDEVEKMKQEPPPSTPARPASPPDNSKRLG